MFEVNEIFTKCITLPDSIRITVIIIITIIIILCSVELREDVKESAGHLKPGDLYMQKLLDYTHRPLDNIHRLPDHRN